MESDWGLFSLLLPHSQLNLSDFREGLFFVHTGEEKLSETVSNVKVRWLQPCPASSSSCDGSDLLLAQAAPTATSATSQTTLTAL